MIYIQPSDESIQINYTIKLSKDIDKVKEIGLIPLPSNSMNSREVRKLFFYKLIDLQTEINTSGLQYNIGLEYGLPTLSWDTILSTSNSLVEVKRD